MAPKNAKSKLKVHFDLDVVSIENIPIALKGDGLTIHWKKSSSSVSGAPQGNSYPFLISATEINFDPEKDHTRFSFDCHLYFIFILIFKY